MISSGKSWGIFNYEYIKRKNYASIEVNKNVPPNNKPL
jgi:hypothetical protein